MEPKETKIFDPADGFSPVTDLAEITDATVAKRGNQWWIYAAGQVAGRMETELFSVSLASGQPLAATGWKLTTKLEKTSSIALLAEHAPGVTWDLKGGRHCPAYVQGWDPEKQRWVERIYYAGAAENLWGPYGIGFLEWDGQQWAGQGRPSVCGQGELGARKCVRTEPDLRRREMEDVVRGGVESGRLSGTGIYGKRG